MRVKYLKNKELNFIRWDNCINNAFNGSIFAYSWYLNILCEDWDALIIGDYEYVMPLLQKTKLNKKIIYSSKLGLRLGIYTNKLITDEIIKEFIESIPSKFQVINLYLNKFNKLPNCKTKNYKSYELDLIPPYKKISSKYTQKYIEKVEYAKKNKITVQSGLLPNDLINFSVKKNSNNKPALNNSDFILLRKIIAHSLRYSIGEIYGAYTKENNLCAACFFIKSKSKIHVLYSTSDDYGLRLNALHLIIEIYIKLNAEKKLTLNVENIILENDPNFFPGIGAKEYIYKYYHINKLSWIHKLLIKSH